MIYGNNHNDKKQRREIENLVGPAYGFIERLKTGGNGSPRLSVSSYHIDFKTQFGESLDRKFINVELREKGILIYIRNSINNYVWPIPYAQLSIFQSGTFNIHGQGRYIKLELNKGNSNSKQFLKKLVAKRSLFMEQHAVPR